MGGSLRPVNRGIPVGTASVSVLMRDPSVSATRPTDVGKVREQVIQATLCQQVLELI